MTNLFPLSASITNSQKVALDSEPNVIISGPAGSGKTFLTVLYAEILKSKNPNHSIQIIILTKSLSSFISKSLNQRGITDVEVNHFASWINRPKSFDYLIIDEVQDLNLNQIKELVKYANIGFYLLGDSNQIIYNDQLKGATIEEIADAFKIKIIELKEIVRFNEGIKNFISAGCSYLENSNVINKEITKPKIIAFNTNDEQFDELGKIISNLPKVGTTGVFVFLNSDVENLLEELSKRNIKVDGYKINSNENLSFNDGAVNILTYHSAKGLEFDNVILPHFDHGNGFPDNIYYVGFSRAKCRLYILYNQHFPVRVKIANKNTFDGTIKRPHLIGQAKLEFEMGFGIYKNIYKDMLSSEEIKVKFQNELQDTINDVKVTLSNSELSEEEINELIQNWIDKT